MPHGLHQFYGVARAWSKVSCDISIAIDFGVVKTAPTECKEKSFQMVSSAYLRSSKAPQNLLMLMIHLRKRSAR